MKQNPDSMKKQELTNDPQEQSQSLTASIPSSDKAKVDEKGMAAQNIHPLYVGDCYKYFRTGKCGKSHCKFNHNTQLPQELRESAIMAVCKYFLSGHCNKGSRCDMRHVMNSDGAEPTPQSTSQIATESRQGTEASGSKLPMSPMNPSVNAQENLQEQRQENIKRQRREDQETLQQHRLMIMRENQNIEAQKQQNMEEQRQKEIERMRLRRLRAALIDFNHFAYFFKCKYQEAHGQGNMEEQRKIEIERMRTEARLRLDQMRPTVLFDERSRPRELMKEFGLEDFEGL